MLRNYFMSALRSFKKDKLFFVYNVIGLSIGLTVSLLSVIFILDESDYDQFHTNKDDIYRISKWTRNFGDGEEYKSPNSPGLFGPTISEEFPEVINAARFKPWWDAMLLSRDDSHVKAEVVAFAEPNFLEMFDFEMVKGNPTTALEAPLSIVLTESLAASLFGQDDPMGKTVKGLGEYDYNVTGIMKDSPRKSHIQFDGLMSWSSTEPVKGLLSYDWMNNWLGQTIVTYVQLHPGADPAMVNEKFPGFVKKYMANRVNNYEFYLQPLNDVYLGSADMLAQDSFKLGSSSYLKTFSAIAVIILFIACINYININTAKGFKRVKEVAVRKVLGAQRKQLIFQFLSEALVVTVISVALAVLLIDILMPYFNYLTGKDLDTTLIYSWEILGIAVAMILFVCLLSGYYPAIVLSRFNPSKTFKQQHAPKHAGVGLRNGLVLFQFVATVVLIAGTLVIMRQVKYMKTHQPGFDQDKVVVLEIPASIDANAAAFKQELLSYPGVNSVATCPAAIGTGTFTTTCLPEGYTDGEFEVTIFRVDYDFLDTYGIKLNDGRYFSSDIASDSADYALVINHTMAELLGWDNPLEKTVRFSEESPKRNVIGVVEDFNYYSLHHPIDPMIMYIDMSSNKNISIRLDAKDIQGTIAQIEQTWSKYEDRHPFDYYFADDWMGKSYNEEIKQAKVVTLFAIFSIVIACLGLYGLSAFMLQHKTKEIGIRKVMGASISGVVVMVNRRLVIMVGLAFLIGSPLAYYAGSIWLEKFAYRIALDNSIFITAGILTLVIALSAVIYQSLKAALMNPVKALRQE
ncbi:MAG: ABC transporter permease [Bacteroidota bacterium]